MGSTPVVQRLGADDVLDGIDDGFETLIHARLLLRGDGGSAAGAACAAGRTKLAHAKHAILCWRPYRARRAARTTQDLERKDLYGNIDGSILRRRGGMAGLVLETLEMLETLVALLGTIAIPHTA